MEHHHNAQQASIKIGRWLGRMLLLAAIPLNGAYAETYVAGQIGYTVAQDTSRTRPNDPTYAGLPVGTTMSSVDLNNALMYGLKLGHYFEKLPWLGVELEGFVTSPHRPQQRLTLGVPGTGNVTVNEGGATNRLVIVSPLLMVRYQAGAFEPYAGIGPGVFFLHQQQLTSSTSGQAYSQSNTGVGLNTQVGMRYRITDHVSLFGEWKFNYARLDLSGQANVNHFGVNAIATLHHFVFGVGYHF